MFNAVRVHNIEQFQKYDEHSRIIFKANDNSGVIGAEFELNTVGPCVARLHLPDDGKKAGKVFLIGVYEGNQTVQFGIAAQSVMVSLEPSGEVWYRKRDSFAVADNPNPDVSFTRKENMGLEMDELGIALHRQAVLNRIEAGRSQLVTDQYTRKVERQLQETNARVDKLLAEREAERQARQDAIGETPAE
ncbi:MAG: hypothetical protein [Wigfec virus K19_56]|nr:MAG: hypothetical protein [Wigfec virus K19_56]